MLKTDEKGKKSVVNMLIFLGYTDQTSIGMAFTPSFYTGF